MDLTLLALQLVVDGLLLSLAAMDGVVALAARAVRRRGPGELRVSFGGRAAQ